MTGSQHSRARALEAATPRQALHAAFLGFNHPETDEAIEFFADWPADLEAALSFAADDQSFLARDNRLGYLGFPG